MQLKNNKNLEGFLLFNNKSGIYSFAYIIFYYFPQKNKKNSEFLIVGRY